MFGIKRHQQVKNKKQKTKVKQKAEAKNNIFLCPISALPLIPASKKISPFLLFMCSAKEKHEILGHPVYPLSRCIEKIILNVLRPI